MTDDSGIDFPEQKRKLIKHGTSVYTARHLHQHTVIGKHFKAVPIDAYFLVVSHIHALRKCQGKFDSLFMSRTVNKETSFKFGYADGLLFMFNVLLTPIIILFPTFLN